MLPKTLEIAPIEKVTAVRDLLMGYTVLKNNEGAKIYDNWVNRLVLTYPLRMRIVRPAQYLKFTDRQSAVWDALEDFQKKDAMAMASHDYYLNRNKMGAGKTIEFIATCVFLNATSILVVCPKTLQTQWVAQFKAWWPERADDVKIYEFGYEPVKTDILLVNPEKIISKKSVGKFNKFTWDVLGVDEAHMIKNRGTRRSVAIKKIPSKHRYALTGTPVLKSPDDLFSIFEFLNPEIAGASYWSFAEYFCHIQEDFFGRHIAGLTKNRKHVIVLQDILKNVSCYNDIEVGQQLREIHVPLTMDKKQEKLYKQILRIELENLPEQITIPNGAVKMTRLLQTTGCPRVFYDPEMCKLPDYPWGVKFEYIAEMLDNNPDLKIVVYSKFATMVELLCKYLDTQKIHTAQYTGKLSLELRNQELNMFIKNPQVRVLAGTIDALGTGVDGMQAVCHVCVFLDRDVRPTINEQCIGRLNRKGQQENVLCYYLECVKSIDKHIDKLNVIRSDDLRELMEEGM